MNSEITLFLAFGLAFGVLILIRVLAGQKHILGKICRWFWNASFKLASHIPLCGWMSWFLIADTDEEKAVKEHYKKVGQEADDFGSAALDAAAKREKRHNLESTIKSRLGRSDVEVINEEVVRIGDKHYTLESVKRKLGI